eukprot:ctg_4031.g617
MVRTDGSVGDEMAKENEHSGNTERSDESVALDSLKQVFGETGTVPKRPDARPPRKRHPGARRPSDPHSTPRFLLQDTVRSRLTGCTSRTGDVGTTTAADRGREHRQHRGRTEIDGVRGLARAGGDHLATDGGSCGHGVASGAMARGAADGRANVSVAATVVASIVRRLVAAHRPPAPLLAARCGTLRSATALHHRRRSVGGGVATATAVVSPTSVAGAARAQHGAGAASARALRDRAGRAAAHHPGTLQHVRVGVFRQLAPDLVRRVAADARRIAQSGRRIRYRPILARVQQSHRRRLRAAQPVARPDGAVAKHRRRQRQHRPSALPATPPEAAQRARCTATH